MVKSGTVNALDVGSNPTLSAKMKICKRHGVVAVTGRNRCKLCNQTAVKKRRKRLKELLVAYKGGKCVRCGYNKAVEALDFHHIDPATKERALSEKGLTLSLTRLKLEADKCLLLCANCHREEHAKEAVDGQP